jgi:hypothetical protein
MDSAITPLNGPKAPSSAASNHELCHRATEWAEGTKHRSI